MYRRGKLQCMMSFYELMLNMFSKSVTVYVAWVYHCIVYK